MLWYLEYFEMQPAVFQTLRSRVMIVLEFSTVPQDSLPLLILMALKLVFYLLLISVLWVIKRRAVLSKLDGILWSEHWAAVKLDSCLIYCISANSQLKNILDQAL